MLVTHRRRVGLAGAMALAAILLAGCLPAPGTWGDRPPVAVGTGQPANAYVQTISCASETNCVVAGSTSARWDGTSWAVTTQPFPTELWSISCVPDTFSCWGVGNGSWITTGNGDYWQTVVASPLQVPSIDCPASGHCVAVGAHGLDPSSMIQDPTDEWSWTEVPVPAPGVNLSGIDCPAADLCFAVGGTGDPVAPIDSTVARWRWDGVTWTSVGDGSAGFLNDISCPTATWCLAVGRGAANDDARIDVWNGTSWTSASIAAAHPYKRRLVEVSCGAPGECAMVQSTFTGTPTGTLRVHQGVWSAGFLDRSITPREVACTVDGTCRLTSGRHVITGDGATWGQPEALPLPRHPNSSMKDVSCTSVTSCLAVGEGHDGEVVLPVAERWDGFAWSVLPGLEASVPGLPPGTDLSIRSVSCVTANWCAVVALAGTESGIGAVRTPVLARWDGSWHVDATPSPPAAYEGADADISCAAVDACTVIQDSWVARWNGTSWTAGTLPGPDASEAAAVSCPTASSCLVVGYRTYWTGNGLTFTAHPVDASGTTFLYDISCVAADRCLAIGAVPGGWSPPPHPIPTYVPIVASFDGATWTLVSAGTATSAVSCVPGRCLASGKDASIVIDAGVNGGSPTPRPGAGFDPAGVSCSLEGCLAVGQRAAGALGFGPMAAEYAF